VFLLTFPCDLEREYKRRKTLELTEKVSMEEALMKKQRDYEQDHTMNIGLYCCA
jgi:hypothetical protein